jgi:aspartate-semialdehyde dehydrogenase
MEKYRVGILGSTGVVGQRLIERLDGHPWFETRGLGASERSVGRTYRDATRWALGSTPPERVLAQTVRACRSAEFDDCDLVFSALDRDIAQEVEPEFADAGLAVVSNSAAFRHGVDVPLIVPEINPDHLALVDAQRQRTGAGYIVTNPNCSTTGLALAMAPLQRAYGVRRLVVATLQAISGAGTTGPRAIEMLDNIVPFIRGEEEKLQDELGRILATVEGYELREPELAVSAHCHRVPTLDGHLEAVSLQLGRDASIEDVVETLRGWRGELAGVELPSAPAVPLIVRDEPDRPQTRIDRDAGNGMSAVIGRVRSCPVLGVRLVVLSHNAVRGAAGGTLLNAELLAARDLLPRRSRA